MTETPEATYNPPPITAYPVEDHLAATLHAPLTDPTAPVVEDQGEAVAPGPFAPGLNLPPAAGPADAGVS